MIIHCEYGEISLTDRTTEETLALGKLLDAELTLAKKNIIFLDIDGVLNGSNLWINCFYDIMYKLKLAKVAHRVVDIFGVHEAKVKRLAKIVKTTNAKVVMSSSRRRAYWKYKNYPSEFKGSSDIIKLDELFRKYGIEVIDITGDDPDGKRGVEILQWLAKHEFEINSFCIIDDEKFDIETLFADRLVYTGTNHHRTGYCGLRSKHVHQAIDLLNNHPLITNNTSIGEVSHE